MSEGAVRFTGNGNVAAWSVVLISRGELSFAAAFAAAACFAALTGGTLFDWDSGDAFSAEEAMEMALGLPTRARSITS